MIVRNLCRVLSLWLCFISIAFADPASWQQTKSQAVVTFSSSVASLFQTPQPQPLALLGWEDGIYISRDGLSLYAVYLQTDALSMILSGQSLLNWYQYIRGPSFNQDFSNPIPGYSTPWLHGDIIQSQRTSLTAPFLAWTLSEARGKYYNRGALVGVLSTTNSSQFRTFATIYDGGPNGNTAVMFVSRNVSRSLTAVQFNLSANVDVVQYKQDNPHIEYFDPAAPNSIVLFFESATMPGGAGKLDIWSTVSLDDGISWTNPAPVTTINTASYNEQQPHLYPNNTDQRWWLYFTVELASTGALAIWRAQGPSLVPVSGSINWDAWGTKELVASCSGTCVGIGEPSLTQAGDLSFVAVMQNKINGTQYDQYDADPWLALSVNSAPITPASATSSSSTGSGSASTSSGPSQHSSSSTGMSSSADTISTPFNCVFTIVILLVWQLMQLH